MINIIYSYVNNGPGKVVKNLKKGFDILGISYKENNLDIKNEDKVIALQWNPIIQNVNPKNLLIGPNICTLPIDNNFVMSKNYKKNIVPSSWVKNKYKRWLPEDKIEVWPAGIDTDFFSDKSKEKKEYDCLVYFKRRGDNDLNFIENFLKEKKQSYKIIKYGMYNENEFVDAISKSRYGIILDNCESQGIAIQEMMSCNLPLLVWDVKTWSDRGIDFSFDSTSIPYWSDLCGEFFFEKDEFDIFYEKFIKNLDKYNPRKFVLENLTLEKRAKQLYDFFK